jgi:hypothetical protein
MTTSELLTALQRTQTPGLDYPRFEQWCRDGDLVKFARLVPSPASCKQAIEDGFGFVRATMPPGAAAAGTQPGAAAARPPERSEAAP